MDTEKEWDTVPNKTDKIKISSNENIYLLSELIDNGACLRCLSNHCHLTEKRRRLAGRLSHFRVVHVLSFPSSLHVLAQEVADAVAVEQSASALCPALADADGFDLSGCFQTIQRSARQCEESACSVVIGKLGLCRRCCRDDGCS